jgi:hypothetical protein
MELSIPVKVVNTQYIFFAEKRKNVIVDGNFIKIIYSTAEFEMNGLHIHFEVDLSPKEPGFISPTKNWAQVLHKSLPHFPTKLPSSFSFDAPASHLPKISDLLPSGNSHAKSVNSIVSLENHSIPTLILRSGIVQSKSGGMDFTSETRRSIHFNLNSANNIDLIDRLCSIEKEIVDRYIACHCPSKSASYILKPQLLSGVIKYNSDNKLARQSFVEIYKEKCMLKISGVWETATNVGITIKFVLLAVG